MRLFHLSEEAGIGRFEPRPSAYTDRPVVWAIAEARIANYLVPRDCPRLCFRAGPESDAADVERFLGPHRAVVAIEAGWEERLRRARLFRYAMPAAGFVPQDAPAGYWVSHRAVTPQGVERLDDLPGAIAAAGATLTVLPSLWALHDAILGSSLVFSMIRMRNAAPRG